MLAAMVVESAGSGASARTGSRPRSSARAALALTRWLPGFAVEPLAGLLAAVYRLLAPRKLRRAVANLDIAFGNDLDSGERLRTARAALKHQAVSLLETARELQRPGSLTIDGIDEFERAVTTLERGGRGQLLITAHLGSWELLNRAATRAAAHGFFALAKQPDQPAASNLLDSLRQSAGTRVLAAGAKSTLRRMLEVLRSGGWIGLAMDQKPDGAGIPVSFFDRRTEFVVGPARLIERQGCRVLAAFCVREGRGRYRLTAHEVVLDPSESAEGITQRLAEELETAIRAHPEQWLWTYRRWPTA